MKKILVLSLFFYFPLRLSFGSNSQMIIEIGEAALDKKIIFQRPYLADKFDVF